MTNHTPALALLLLSCAASQHAPSRYGTVRVTFDEARFSGDQLSAMRDQLRTMEALGPSFAEASADHADVTVAASDGPCTRTGAAGYESQRHRITINTTCLTGTSELRAALGHELGHHLGLGHVCVRDGDAPDCSPVGYGYAVMNPSLTTGDVFSDGPPFPVPTVEPTPLDFTEFRRVHR